MELPKRVIAVVFELPYTGGQEYGVWDNLWATDGVMEINKVSHTEWRVTYALHEEGDDLKAIEAKLLAVMRGKHKF